MEPECTACSKGLFALGIYLADSDVLLQVLEEHKSVPASQKCPKCDTVLNINQNYYFRCDRQTQVCVFGERKRFPGVVALKGTFFEKSHLSKIEIIPLSYWFVLN